MTSLVPVLIAGGSGTRLWPTSRQSYPKQFVDLVDSGDSLLQSTLKRIDAMTNPAPWIIVTREDYRFLVAQQARETGNAVSSIILEPLARNTAPAITLAALEALSLYDTPRLLIQTADHYIKDLTAFGKMTTQAFDSSSPFVLFGVKPTRAETGYGYIQCGTKQGCEYAICSFTEKPDLKTADHYFRSGDYLWNSGMFMLDAKAYIKVIKKFEPLIYKACEEAHRKATNDLDFKRIDPEAFSTSPTASIDYAIMERVKNLVVIPYQGDWSDLGAWDSIAVTAKQDKCGNAVQGDGLLIDSFNTLVRAESRLVTGIGLKDLVIVETSDAVLVVDTTKTQSVKELVAKLNSQNRKVATDHQKVFRPWGCYEMLIRGDRFQVKQLIVEPGQSLSLQMHHYRAEHWVVVSGVAEVYLNEVITRLTEGQSIYIPTGSKHRLANREPSALVLIEVQSGEYIGEDDIVRFEDIYGRE